MPKKIKKVKIKEKKVKVISKKDSEKKKPHSLEEEVEDEESKEFEEFISGKRSSNVNGKSSLDQDAIDSTVRIRSARFSKEDENEINFRPSYSPAGNPYQESVYKPSTGAEQAYIGNNEQQRRDPLIQENELINRPNNPLESQNSNRPAEYVEKREYIGKKESELNKKS